MNTGMSLRKKDVRELMNDIAPPCDHLPVTIRKKAGKQYKAILFSYILIKE